jgi:hypothetical protein
MNPPLPLILIISFGEPLYPNGNQLLAVRISFLLIIEESFRQIIGRRLSY